MNDELKACPFCGAKLTKSVVDRETLYEHPMENGCRLGVILFTEEEWNTRPIEDALEARIDELEAQLSEARARLAEYEAKSVVIKFMNEDELPKIISDDVYSAMFNCSHVDFVRLFPYIEENDEKYYLVMLKEDE